MTGPQRQVYRLIVALHPAAFRDEFGREMTLDCEDALGERGFAPLLGDALLSLGRQWKVRLISGPELAAVAVGEPVPGHPFLSGQYVAIGRGPSVTVFDLTRASALSLLLMLTIGFAASVPNRRVIGDVQTVHVSHDGGVDTGNNQPPAAGRARKEAGEPLQPQDADGYGTAQFHGRLRLSPPAAGISGGARASGGPTAIRPLADAVREFVLISLIIWLTSYFLSRSPGVLRKIFLAALGLLGIAASVAFGQRPTAPMHTQLLHATGPLPSFEVATIKLIKDGRYGFHQGGQDEVYIVGRPARFLIGEAYNLPPGAKDQLIGGPAWMDTNEYQVDAKIDGPLAATLQKLSRTERQQRIKLMEQSLFADRFKLKVHFEIRELPVYALVVAKSGLKLTPAKDLPPLDPSQPFRPRNPDDLRGSLMIVPKGGPMFEMIVKGESLDQFANMLTPHPEIGGRPVVNQTGLSGAYDFTMDWAREQEAGTANDTGGPGLFAALEQQLGLTLVSTRAKVEVVVIDHIELPSEN